MIRMEGLGLRDLGLREQGILMRPEGPCLYKKYSDRHTVVIVMAGEHKLREIELGAWHISHFYYVRIFNRAVRISVCTNVKRGTDLPS